MCSATLGNALQSNRKKTCEVIVLFRKYYHIKDIIKCERAVRALPAMTVLSKTLYSYRHSHLDGDTDRIRPKRNESIKAAVRGLSDEISTEHLVHVHIISSLFPLSYSSQAPTFFLRIFATKVRLEM